MVEEVSNIYTGQMVKYIWSGMEVVLPLSV
jgi:hypothetical protein